MSVNVRCEFQGSEEWHAPESPGQLAQCPLLNHKLCLVGFLLCAVQYHYITLYHLHLAFLWNLTPIYVTDGKFMFFLKTLFNVLFTLFVLMSTLKSSYLNIFELLFLRATHTHRRNIMHIKTPTPLARQWQCLGVNTHRLSGYAHHWTLASSIYIEHLVCASGVKWCMSNDVALRVACVAL